MIVYLLWRLATVLARLVPLRPSYFCATILADLTFYTWREKREIVIENMGHVLPDATPETVRNIARQSFRNYAKYLIDFIRSPKIRPEEIDGKIVFDNWEAIEAARSEGKGIIFALMHFGNWDMGGWVLTQRGYSVNVIAEPMEHDKLNEMIVAARTLAGMRVIPLGRSAFSILRALRRNEILAILLDRPMAENGICVRFFGRPTILPAGPARLAQRTGAHVIPVALVRLHGTADRLLALIEPDLRFENTGNEEYDLRVFTEAILAAHERFIRRFPDQWYMFRRMWLPASPTLDPEHALAREG